MPFPAPTTQPKGNQESPNPRHPPPQLSNPHQRPLHLLNLPIEVLHQILAPLTSSLSTFLTLRLVSRDLSFIATSHHIFRRHLLSVLPSRHAALRELSLLPAEAWSLHLLSDGWFRALVAINKAIREPWLKCEDDLDETDWLVFFKEMLPDGVHGVGVDPEHSTIRFSSNGNSVVRVGGMPLISRKWALRDGAMTVTGYPPNVPGREPRTLARKLEHVTVAMLSDCPEFLAAMRKVDEEVLRGACDGGVIGSEDVERRKARFQKAWEAVDWSPQARIERLKGWLQLKSGKDGRRNEDHGRSSGVSQLGQPWVHESRLTGGGGESSVHHPAPQGGGGGGGYTFGSGIADGGSGSQYWIQSAPNASQTVGSHDIAAMSFQIHSEDDNWYGDQSEEESEEDDDDDDQSRP